MNHVQRIVASLTVCLPLCSVYAASDDAVYNTINTSQVIVPDQGAALHVARRNENVPCKQNPITRALQRNQNDFIGQCDFESRLKVSGLLRLSMGGTNHAIGEDNGGTGSDVHRMLTFIKDSPGITNINIDTMNDIKVDRATMNFDGIINDWAEAHLGLVYWSENFIFKNAQPQWYSRYTGNFQGNGNTIPIDEASLVIGDFSKSPFYFRLGRQYVDFGWYDKNTTMSPMTQWFSQGSHDAVTFGMLDYKGISANISAFRSVSRGDNIRKGTANTGTDRPSDSVNNFSASISYGFDYERFSLDMKADYMFDMFGVDFFDGYLGNGIIGSTPADFDTGDGVGNNIRPDEHVSMGAFTIVSRFWDLDLKMQYVGALSSMQPNIWSVKGEQTGSGVGNFNTFSIEGARPHAWSTELGFSVPVLGRDSRLSIALHRTESAYAGQSSDRSLIPSTISNYYIPRKRVEFKAEHNFMKHVDMMASFIYDNDYTDDYFGSLNNQSNGGNPGNTFNNLPGTRNHNTMLVMSITAQFA